MTSKRIILHLDMDSFFASVEVREDPDLTGKPVVIGADPQGGQGRGVVSTCSYEARKYGIHSAMPISKAFQLCPGAVYLPVRMQLYREASDRIMRILSGYTDRFAQVSIDEAYLDVTATGSFENALLHADRIREDIRSSEGLTCSVGVAPGKILAKIASDHQKPDGMTVVTPDRAAEFLAPLPVKKIPGIGKKTELGMHRLGIVTIGQLAAYDVQELIARFGRWGIALRQLANGIDESEITERGGRKSISREITFGEDTGDLHLLARALDALADDVHRRLQVADLRCRTVTVKVRFSGYITRTRSRSLPHCTNDPDAIGGAIRSLFREMYTGAKVRLIGVRLSNFDETSSQQTLLDEFGLG
jgi:DNA polymerase IV (DinB-like DNA polymerase)